MFRTLGEKPPVNKAGAPPPPPPPPPPRKESRKTLFHNKDLSMDPHHNGAEFPI